MHFNLREHLMTLMDISSQETNTDPFLFGPRVEAALMSPLSVCTAQPKIQLHYCYAGLL